MTPTRAIERTWELLNNVQVDLGFMTITLFTYLLVPVAITVLMIFFKFAISSVRFTSSANAEIGKRYFKNKEISKKKHAKEVGQQWIDGSW